jgi:hypothetical protein
MPAHSCSPVADRAGCKGVSVARFKMKNMAGRCIAAEVVADGSYISNVLMVDCITSNQPAGQLPARRLPVRIPKVWASMLKRIETQWGTLAPNFCVSN